MKDELFRWVHISDLHIGHEDYVETVMRDELPEYLRKVIGRNKVDSLFVTGDLIYAKEYAGEKKDIRDKEPILENIERIQEALSVEDKDTFMVAGNHDIVRDKNRSTVIRQFLPKYDSRKGVVDDNVLQMIESSEQRFGLLYKEILGRDYNYLHHVEQGPKGINIVCLNTTMFCEVMEEDGKTRVLKDKYLIMGSKLLRAGLQQVVPGHPVIVLGHHPIAAFSSEEQSMIVRSMKKAGVILYLCGHTHAAEVSNISGDDKNPIWQICCGTNMEKLENGDPADMKIFVGEYSITKNRGFVRSYRYDPKSEKKNRWETDPDLIFPKSELDENLGIDRFYFPQASDPTNYVYRKYSDYMNKLTKDIEIYVRPIIEHDSKKIYNSSEGRLRYVVKADTGYGKTFLLKKLIRYFLFEDTDIDWETIFCFEDRNIIPLWISCKSLEGSLENFDPLDSVAKELKINDETNYPYKEIFWRWCRFLEENGQLLLLVDGLDEINDDERRNEFVAAMKSYLDKNSNTGVIIVSKPYVYDNQQIGEWLKEFVPCDLCSFDEDSIRKYCKKWFEVRGEGIPNKDRSKRAANLSEKICGDRTIYELARIPLLLDTMLQVNKLNDTLPGSRVTLYREWIYALLKDSKKIEEDISLLAAIAFEMKEKGLYEINKAGLKQIIESMYRNCDWIFLEDEENPFEQACVFLNRIEKNSRIIVKNNKMWSFYHGAFQDYLASLALTKGLYLGLKEQIEKPELPERYEGSPVLCKLLDFVFDSDKSEIIILAIAQMGAYDSAVIIEQLIHLVDNDESDINLEKVRKSNIRNLLLRVILEGAYVTRSQRNRIYEVVQKHNLSDLQADSMQRIWNSRFGKEFKATCSSYMNEMFELLSKSSNPVGELLDQIRELENKRSSDNEKELEKALYVLDGIIWSNGLKYLNKLEGENREEKFDKLVGPIFRIILNRKTDGISARRACGVIHRLIDTGAPLDLDEKIIFRIFEIFSCRVEEKYREKEDVDYSGIRVFSAIPHSETNIQYIKKINLDQMKKNFLIDLFDNAQNLQDKYASFWAVVLSKSWDSSKIENVIASDDVFLKSPIADRDYIRTEISKLDQMNFFDSDNGLEERQDGI